MKTLGCLLLTVGMLGVALAAGPDSDDVDSLRRQYAYLQSLPPARQQQIRALDKDLNDLDQETQDRLRRVMANYNYWLSHLPEADRSRVVDAPTANARLKIIGELKDREWLETLPKAYRERYAKATPVVRPVLLKDWRYEERERREEWQIVRQNWKDFQDEGPPLIPQTPEFRQQLEVYVQNLAPQLPQEPRDRLLTARIRALEQRAWINYLRLVVEYTDRYPLLPGPQDGPRNFDSLPKADMVALERNRKKQPKELQSSQGRWPDYAIAVTNYAAKRSITLPQPLGPVNKTTMPENLRVFIEKELEPAMRKAAQIGKADKVDKREKAEQAKRDLARLHEAEGKWPDYPRTVTELAHSYKLTIPGWMLPGKPEFWDRFRTLKKTK